MRRLFVVFLVLCSSAFADESADEGVEAPTTVVCFPTKVLLSKLKNFGEEPLFIGKSLTMPKTATMVYVNKNTGSYTIIEIDKEAGCVISLGTKGHYRFPRLKESL